MMVKKTPMTSAIIPAERIQQKRCDSSHPTLQNFSGFSPIRLRSGQALCGNDTGE
jgi:hypothetical protein